MNQKLVLLLIGFTLIFASVKSEKEVKIIEDVGEDDQDGKYGNL